MAGSIEISTSVFCKSVAEHPHEARLVLGTRMITVDGEDIALEIDLSDVFDIRVGPPPQAASGVFGGTVLTIGLDRDDKREVLFVNAAKRTLEKVSGLLYRRILDGTEVAVRHPAEVGGRVTGRSYDIGTLQVTPGKVGCMGIEIPCVTELDAVVDFSRSTEELLGREQSTITITYVTDGTAISLDLSMNPARKQHLLGRFLRQEYDEVRRDLSRIDVPDSALGVLAKLYSLRGSASHGSLLGGTSQSTATLLRALVQRDLVEVDEDRVTLTPRGWVLATEFLGRTDPPSTPSDAKASGARS